MIRDDRASSLPLAIQHILERRDRVVRAGGDTPVNGVGTRKIGLLVQGGCMRSVFTAGALCALDELGVRPAFDVVYGSSGGAVNAAYFLADQIELGTSIYTSDINNRAFIDFRRIFAGTAADIDFCFDEVVGRRKALDLHAVLRSPARLAIYVTRHAPIRVERFVQHEIDSAADLLTLLKASAAMPLVYRRPVFFRGGRYLDGGLMAPVPLLEAIADGCTDILVLLSRPLDSPWKGPPAWLRRLILRSIDRHRVRSFARAWSASDERLARGLALLRHAALESGPGSNGNGVGTAPNGDGGIHFACAAPPADFRVTRWTTDGNLLAGAARAGARAVFELFGAAASAPTRPAPAAAQTSNAIRACSVIL